jgi:hypothetical protein
MEWGHHKVFGVNSNVVGPHWQNRCACAIASAFILGMGTALGQLNGLRLTV